MRVLRWRRRNIAGWPDHLCLGSLLVRCACGQRWLLAKATLTDELIQEAQGNMRREVELGLTQELAQHLLQPCPTCGAAIALVSNEEG